MDSVKQARLNCAETLPPEAALDAENHLYSAVFLTTRPGVRYDTGDVLL